MDPISKNDKKLPPYAPEYMPYPGYPQSNYNPYFPPQTPSQYHLNQGR